jgi:hypothetical protein
MDTDHFQIPSNFLSSAAPEGAWLQKIDFTCVQPPMPEYRGCFAAAIDNALTKSECDTLLRIAEASTITPECSTPTWERAMINAGGGRQVLATDVRNCGRIIYDSPLLAQRLLDRLLPFLREWKIDRLDNLPIITGIGPVRRREILQLSRLNERLRFLRYEGSEYFSPHCDGAYATPDGQEISYFTIHLYLNGDGEQNLEELNHEIKKVRGEDGTMIDERESRDLSSQKLLGGATSFMSAFNTDEIVRIFPKTGSVLVFQHKNLWHAGDIVFRGVKYTVRTDIMYRTIGLN